MEDWTTAYFASCMSVHGFSEIQKKFVLCFCTFYNGDGLRSRNYTASQFTFAFLHLRQKNRSSQSC